MNIPSNIQDMIDDFTFLDDWEERYMHVIEMGRAMPPLNPNEQCAKNKVNGCVSQVWLITKQDMNNNVLRYRGDSDAHIVKGLVAIVIHIFSGRTPKEITEIDAQDILMKLGLAEHLSAQRSNGLNAMISRIQSEAISLLASTSL